MPIYEHQQGSYQFNRSVRNILQNCENICQGAVDYDYIEKKIQSCDFLYVNYEPLEDKLIGFAVVFDYGDELYIDVICNLPKNNNKRKKDEREEVKVVRDKMEKLYTK